MGYIRYLEVRELYSKKTLLVALLESLQVDLAAFGKMDALTYDAYYTGAVGNHVLSDTPHPPAGLTSDKTGNMATTYRGTLLYEKKETKHDIRCEVLEISTVLEKLTIAYNVLNKREKEMLQLKYLEEYTWREVASQFKVVERNAQLVCEKAFRKMAGVIRLDFTQYDAVMKLLEEANDKDGL
jgi:hypothetical protein